MCHGSHTERERSERGGKGEKKPTTSTSPNAPWPVTIATPFTKNTCLQATVTRRRKYSRAVAGGTDEDAVEWSRQFG